MDLIILMSQLVHEYRKFPTRNPGLLDGDHLIPTLPHSGYGLSKVEDMTELHYDDFFVIYCKKQSHAGLPLLNNKFAGKKT